MKFKIFLIAAALLSASVLSSGQEAQTKKVAILETVDREGTISYGIRLMLRSSLSYAITNTPGYEGYDRVDLESIVGEQSFQRTGMVSDEQIRKLGEMTGAAYILVAEAAKVDDSHIFITAKILNVESAKLEATANVQTLTQAKEIEEGCKELASMLLGSGGIEEKKTEKKPAEKSEARTQAELARQQEMEAVNAYKYSIESTRKVPEGIHPGMKYRQYRKLYNASDYVRMPGDKYSPAVGGICSFLIPGLGQIINGDAGRGFAFMGTTIGSALVGSLVGLGLADSAEYDPVSGEYNEGQATAGVIIFMAGILVACGAEIWAIIDGGQHAKIKNMYMRDIRGFADLDVKLTPYVACTSDISGRGATPAIGMSLNISF